MGKKKTTTPQAHITTKEIQLLRSKLSSSPAATG